MRGVLLQALQANGFELRRQPEQQPRGRNRVAGTDLRQRLDDAALLERRTAGQTFVEDRAERVHIDPRSKLFHLTRSLFGRHVAGRSEDRARMRMPVGNVRSLGQTEVRDARRTVLGQKDVARLEIPVDRHPRW